MVIYEIKNLIDSKVYIGKTVAKTPEKRWYDHTRLLNKGTHYNYRLQNAWDTTGKDNFLFSVIDSADSDEDLCKLEIQYIAKYNSQNPNFGYNLTFGGDSSAGKPSKWEGVFALGARYGSWTITDPKIIVSGARREARIAVKCDCGTEKLVWVAQLYTGKTISCGCHRKRTGQAHHRYKGTEDVSGTTMYNLTRSAVNSMVPMSVNSSTLQVKLDEQGKLCAMSGVPISVSDCTAVVTPITMSLGYISGNVQWVHKDVKTMQGDMMTEEFIAMCKKIAEMCDKDKNPNPIIDGAKQITKKFNK